MSQFDGLRFALARLHGTIVAIDDVNAGAIVNLSASLARGIDISDQQLAAACGPRRGEQSLDAIFYEAFGRSRSGTEMLPTPQGKAAIVTARGVATYDLEMQPYAFSVRQLEGTMKELAADKTVSRIVVMADTPGGGVLGLQEASDAIFAARQTKEVTGLVAPLATSAGYWLLSQATTVAITPSGLTGSIGVRSLHLDLSEALAREGVKPTLIYSGKFKVEANSFFPLTPEARARWQAESDVIYGQFLKAVARGRGVGVERAKRDFGEGRVMMADEALSRDMVDTVEPTGDSFDRIATGRTRRGSGAHLERMKRIARL